MASKRKLQVFVSSTFEDLKTERQAAVSAILKIGHIPAGMELFTAGDQSQMNIIQRWIDESDVYMLILGGRYGSIEEKSGMSYTELEYDYAVMQSKPLFAVVIGDGVIERKILNSGISCVETKNPQRLVEFRKKVLGNMSSFYSDEKDIALAVYESLSELAATRDMKGWVSADEVGNSAMLQQELNTIRAENAQLKKRIEALQSAPVEKGSQELVSRLDEIEDTLGKITVDIPVNVVNEEGRKNTLHNLFYHGKDRFLIGITNKPGMSDFDRFLFFNVGPKLNVHGLVDSEALPGVTYRRMFATKLGIEILARLDKRVASGEVKFITPDEQERKIAKKIDSASDDVSQGEVDRDNSDNAAVGDGAG